MVIDFEKLLAETVERAAKRIAELETALETAATRFEYLAARSDEMINGVKPSVGAAECRAALSQKK